MIYNDIIENLKRLEKIALEKGKQMQAETMSAEADALQMAVTWAHEKEKQAAELERVKRERDVLLQYCETQCECSLCENDGFCKRDAELDITCKACNDLAICPCRPCKWKWKGIVDNEH